MKFESFVSLFIVPVCAVAALILVLVHIERKPVSPRKISEETVNETEPVHKPEQPKEDERDSYIERQFKRKVIKEATGFDPFWLDPDPTKHLFP